MSVTAVVPTYNEERHVERCLRSLLGQRGVDDVEIVVVDGRSEDRTAEIVRALPEFGTRVRLLDNPNRLQVYAWNIGWRAARGEYVACIVAHTEYDPFYLRSCVEVLERTGAEAVGPVQAARGSGTIGTAIAWCMSSPFGVGNARFRFARSEEEVDSAFSLFTRRTTFERLGGYDERIAFDEDDEFNYRLRAAGGKIIVSPELKVRYYVRDSLRALARQMYRYGYWRRATRLIHPQDVPLRVYVPPALLLGLVVSLALLATPLRAAAAAVPAAYAGFLVCGVVSAARTLNRRCALAVAPALASMHLSYGAGFLYALATRPSVILGTNGRTRGR